MGEAQLGMLRDADGDTRHRPVRIPTRILWGVEERWFSLPKACAWIRSCPARRVSKSPGQAFADARSA